MHLRKASTYVCLRSPRRLTWVDTFHYIYAKGPLYVMI